MESVLARIVDEDALGVEGAGAVLKNVVDQWVATTHILFVDACHTSDGWMIYIACFVDPNHHVQPIGFRLCEAEDEKNWLYFLHALKRAGVNDGIEDLVIMSDRSPAIIRAVDLVFPRCEHAHCIVHFERNLQLEWDKVYHGFNKDYGIEMFNIIVNLFRDATIAVSQQECDEYLQKIKQAELVFRRTVKVPDPRDRNESKNPIYDYVRKCEGVYMWKWKYNHLLEQTSNAVESVMNELTLNLFHKGVIRSSPFFDRYRLLVMLILLRMKQRYNEMTSSKGILPMRSNHWGCFTPWAVSLVFRRFHYVLDYAKEYTVKACRYGVDGHDNGSHEYYNVKDGTLGKRFKVDLRNWKNGCSCHIHERQQMPCTHIIAVLIELKQYQMVWGFVGSVYSLQSLGRACREWTQKEDELYHWLSKQVVKEHPKKLVIWRSVKKGNGKNKRRWYSRGECPVGDEVSG